MKTYSKIKGIFYRDVIIQDESGMDIIQIKKEVMLSSFAARLREIARERTSLKVLA